jgi:hypothetical protein
MARRTAANIAWLRTRLGDQAQFYTAAELLSALNEANRDIARRANALVYETRALVPMTAGVEPQALIEDSEGAHVIKEAIKFRWPDTFVYPVEITFDPKHYEDEKLRIGDASGQPRIMLFVRPDLVQMWPMPDDAHAWSVHAAWYPYDMEDDDGDPEIDVKWDFVLRFGALFFLTGTPEAKALYDERFNAVQGAEMNVSAGELRVKHSSDRIGF